MNDHEPGCPMAVPGHSERLWNCHCGPIRERQRMNKEKKSGFEPIPQDELPKVCHDPSHRPPTHLYIPPGQRYRHVCPSCGYEVVLQPPQVRFQANDVRQQA